MREQFLCFERRGRVHIRETGSAQRLFAQLPGLPGFFALKWFEEKAHGFAWMMLLELDRRIEFSGGVRSRCRDEMFQFVIADARLGKNENAWDRIRMEGRRCVHVKE